MLSLNEALVFTAVMGAVILFCRLLPFLLFLRDDPLGTKRNKAVDALLDFVERVVPPAAMTVLAFNALGTAFKENLSGGFCVLAASLCTALLHLWKRNFLISILSGTVLYMVLTKV